MTKKIFLTLLISLILFIQIFPEIKDSKISTTDSITSFTHNEWKKSTKHYEYINLKVGELYKLTGKIKTENALTNAIDRYPTSVAACLTMESFPFTNHSPAVGDTTDWKEVSIQFIATKSKDRIRVHLGFNGKAMGKAWFKDLKLEKSSDISTYIPPQTVKWFNKAYRYDDRGWIFVHIEGKPYNRGYQYGYLLSEEIVSYIKKLAYSEDKDNSVRGWNQLRRFTDAIMLRRYEDEYLEEMKGIADGAKKNGAKFSGRDIDLIDIVTLNSYTDIDSVNGALRKTANSISGRNFFKTEDELNIPLKQHKCSGFLANGPATKDNKIVFGQIFMWGGYTGVHWNVICDLVPEKGNRIVYETYPGGIHSGADFYINSAGIMMGETTVSQTPFNQDGTPQSNRIRKAAQYANSIDDVAKILKHKNNGMYTNDWLIGDTKTNEIAIFLLGTNKTKMWRSKKGNFPNGTKGFLWSNNNNKDPEVRKEYIPNKDNAPFDLVFRPWNRDIAFNEFFKKKNGIIDSIEGVNLWASSPINRSHACDGKITTTEMANNLTFLAHFGKVTLRGKFPHPDNRLLRAYPGATPHLSLGYSTASPIFITKKLIDQKGQIKVEKTEKELDSDYKNIKDVITYSNRSLWFNTVFPASNKENWFISATASYWRILKYLPDTDKKAYKYLTDQLSKLDISLNYTINREGDLQVVSAKRKYDGYNNYQIPRIKGTYLLHQLRLNVGNKKFSKIMNAIHDKYKNKKISNSNIISIAENISGKKLNSFINQWIDKKGFPSTTLKIDKIEKTKGGKWNLSISTLQNKELFHFYTDILIRTKNENIIKKIEINKKNQMAKFELNSKPEKVIFNHGNHIPEKRESYYIWSNFYDDFSNIKIVYGTKRQIEANHTFALKFQTAIADRYSEVFSPIFKDNEISKDDISNSDLILLGGTSDNTLTKDITDLIKNKYKLKTGKNYFKWQDKTYGSWDDGLFLVIPNPYNKKKIIYLIISNSALQLYHMTNKFPRNVKSWSIYKKEKIIKNGYHK